MSRKFWQRIFSVLLMAGMLVGFIQPLSVAAAVPLADYGQSALQVENTLDKVEGLVLEEIQTAGATDFFVWMAEKADLSPADDLKTKAEKSQFVFETLRATAERTQRDLRGYLENQRVDYKPFYITNKILVYGGSLTLMENLVGRSDVAEITANHKYQLQEPFDGEAVIDSPTAVEPNITFINADDAWTLGVDGSGTVMAGNDTGLDETHPTIAPHYRGCMDPPTCSTWDHNYNWWDATGTYPTDPWDGYGHGTHTTGTMVGDDGGANQIGVAPGAQTVHCKNMTDSGSGDDFTFTECFQWDLAPWDLSGANPDPAMAPDAVNNSWGYWGGGAPQFENEIAALQAAGIAVEVSAGNEGSGCGTLRSPGDYEQVLTTGSINHAGGVLPGTLTGFSSRGPSSLYPNDYFPDIMAPGENVRSALPGNQYGSWGGTSMAGPHATALVGLMWDANPALAGNVAMTYELIRETAVPLTGQGGSNCGGDYTDGPNNDWGHGTIDALAAVQAAFNFGGTGSLEGNVIDNLTMNPLQYVDIAASLSPTQTWTAQTDMLGDYSMVVLSGTYTVTASLFGYIPGTVTGVTVISGSLTTQDFALDPAPSALVYGYVTDVNTGWPLYASINIAGYPGGGLWTDPVTGYYEVNLPTGSSYDFHVAAFVGGYVAQNVTVGPVTGDMQQDFALDVDVASCSAPGYSPTYSFFDDFENGYGNWTMTGLWNAEAEGDTCGSLVAPFPSSVNASWYGIDGVCTFNNGNANSGELTMVNPVSLPSGGSLSFWSFEETECGGDCSYDNRYIQISTNGGGTWTTLAEGNVEGQWLKYNLDLSAYSGMDALFRFRFDTVDSIANDYFGWMVDDIAVATGCSPSPGGLVVGNVYEDNFNTPLTGAMVYNDSGEMTYADVTADPNVDDAFYTLFSPSGSHVFTATMTGYNDGVEVVNVVNGDTAGQDFYLSSGALVVDPTSLHVTVPMGSTDTQPMTLTNVGTGDAYFEISEKDLGFIPGLLGAADIEITSRERLDNFDPNATSTAGILSPGGTEALGLLAAGDVLDQWPAVSNSAAWGIASVDDDSIWVGDGWGTLNIYEYLPDGTPTGLSWPYPWSPANGPADDTYNQNTGMVWTLDVGGDDCLHELDPSSGYTGNTICGPWGISQRGLAYDPQTDSYFAGGWNEGIVYHIDSTGSLIQSWSLGLSISGLAYNHEASLLFIIENSATDTVTVFDVVSGSIVDSFTIPGFGNYGGAGLSIACDGSLWAVNQANDNVYLVDSGVPGSLCAADVPWLSEDPISGTVSAGLDQIIDVTFDASAVGQPGDYQAELKVDTDTPYPAIVVPVTMTVLAPASYGKLEGTVMGLGYCDADPMVLEEAEVYIESSTGMTWTLQTDAAGYYSYWLDEGGSPYEVTVTYPEHETGNDPNVIIVGTLTTTLDFDLRWLKPCVDVTPDSLQVTLDMGLSTMLPLTVTNTGAAQLDFEFQEKNGGYNPALLGGVAPEIATRMRMEAFDPNATSTADILTPGGTEPLGLLGAGDVLDQWPSGLALPWGTGFSFDDNTVWLSDPGAGGGDDLDHEYETDGTPTGRTIYAMFGGAWGGDLAFNPNTGMLWQVNVGGDNCLYELDPASGQTGNSVCGPWTISQRGVAYDPVTDSFYVGGWNDLIVYHIDSSGGLIEQWNVGLSISGLAYNFEAGLLFIIENSPTDTVSVFDVASGSIVDSFTIAGFGNYVGSGLEVDCDGNLWAANQGDGNAYLVDSGVPANLCASDIPWLFEDPISGTLPADTGLLAADITFDAGVPEITQPGEYFGTLKVSSNDPVNDNVSIPVTMTVLASPDLGKLEGTVTGLGYCDMYPAGLEDAEVSVSGSGGGMWSLMTDEFGYYSMWINAPMQSPVTVTVSYPEHEMGQATDIQIGAGMTTTVDFDLRWIVPCVSVDPDVFDVTVGLGYSMTHLLELMNAGAGDTSFELAEQIGGFTPSLLDNVPLIPAGSMVVPEGASSQASVQPFAPRLNQESILHITTTDTSQSVERALNELGFAYDYYYGTPWTGIDFTPYDIVIVGMDGGLAEIDDIAKLRTDVLDAGKKLIFMGGTCYQPFAMGMNQYLVLNDVNNYCWTISGTPHWTLVDAGHPLADGLPDSYNFINSSAAYYQIRVNDPNIEPVAMNGDGYYNFFRKNADFPLNGSGTQGTGDFIWFINSVYSFYWGNQADFDVLKQLIYNSVTVSGEVDIPWLYEVPVTGTVGADSNFFVDLIFDASVLTETGDYTGTLKVKSEDPMTDTVEIPLTLHVVPPAYGVELGGEYAKTGIPNEIVMYTLVVTNASNGPTDTFDVSVGSSVFPAVPDVTQVGPLAAGESASIQVAVQIPDSALPGESDAVDVMVTSQGDNTKMDTATLTTSVGGSYGVMTHTDQAEGSGVAGGMVTYSLSITNTGSLQDTIVLTYHDVEPGWEVHLVADSFDLAGGESVDTMFHVLIPAGAVAGDWDMFTLQAKSSHDPSKWNEMEFMTTVNVPQIYLPFINRH